MGYDECFYCCCVIFWIGVIEFDQQIGVQVYVFLVEVYQQQVVGKYQNYYVGDEQVGVSEEVRVVFFIVYILGGVYVNKEIYISDY